LNPYKKVIAFSHG